MKEQPSPSASRAASLGLRRRISEERRCVVEAAFSGERYTRGLSGSATGTVPTEIVLQAVSIDSLSADPTSATIRKTGDNNMLRVQVLVGREVVESQSTTEPYGIVNLTRSPNR